MKCPICGKDVELQKKQIGTSESGDPIFNEYAICRDCRKQWNLDKQRAKKMAAKKDAEKQTAQKDSVPENRKKTSDSPVPKKSPVSKDSSGPKKTTPKTNSDRQTVRKKAVPEDSVPTKKSVKKRPVQKVHGSDTEEQKYGNIPSEKVRAKREKAVKKGYEDMLATDPGKKPVRKKTVSDKTRMIPDEQKLKRNERTKYPSKTEPVRRKPEPVAAEYDEYDEYDDEPRFRPLRIVLGIVSLIGFAFFIYRGFVTGLDSVSSGDGSTTGMTYIILALCMFVSALLYFIMLNRETILAFLFPMVFYLGGGVFGFFRREDSIQLLIGAVICAVLAVLSLIFAIVSRGGDDYEDEDYEDAFEDDHDNY